MHPNAERAFATATDAERNILEKGYFVYRNVLSASEIESLRTASRMAFKAGGRAVPGGGYKQANAAVEVPAIQWLLYHPNVLQSFRDVLGTQSIMYTSHTDIQKDVLGGWHKDDGTNESQPDDRGYFAQFNYDNEDCRVYKMGVYLQDHDQDEYGLTVREGSHRTKSFTAGDVRYTGAKAGDVVVFDVRITHRGQTKTRLQAKLFPTSGNSLQRSLDSMFTRVRKLYRNSIGRERIAIFFTFGAPNNQTIDFGINNMRRQLRLTPGTSPRLPDNLREEFHNHDVLLAEDHFPQFSAE